MVNLFKKLQAKRRIPSEVYQLIENINSKYSQLNLDNGDFKELNESEKVSKLISMIDEDSEISRLNSLSYIGSIHEAPFPEKSTMGGFGTNLCIGEKGLFIHDWNDYDSKRDDISATPKSLKKYFGKEINAEKIKDVILNYTNQESYIKRVADFDKFKE